ncbi:MAG TPA: UDP-N-acetylmuramoyl-tripeptide--D-alanyl-D-alanine ligase [Patescibacteria group bacterium]|nr:UDP-N-acetylmuramoyl-tripeptide--D-alanyl-D-alanine ligase [Patescibacteria group bacterium]
MAKALRSAGFRDDGPVDGFIEGVSIDTRSGCAGALFVALPGTHGDGHEFLGSAVEQGAVALLVSIERIEDAHAVAGGIPVLGVPDPLEGLQAIAAAYRDLVDPIVIAVTGSTGKTATKELIAAVVSSRFTVHATPGNLNNHIGLPLTLLGMEGNEEILVAEMGANHKNEIKLLAGIARPGIGVITNIGPGHLEFFGSLKGVAAAKAELLQALPDAGTAILPADDEFLEYLRGRTRAAIVTFGFADGADLRIHITEKSEGAGYRFKIGAIETATRLFGRHHLLNAAAAVAVGSVLDIPAEAISSAIAGHRAVDGRGVLYLLDGITFVDDSYNANPASLRAAVDAFMEMPIGGKRYLVLGDMLELGELSGELHREAGIYCGKAGLDGLFTLGSETVELNRAAAEQRKAPSTISHFIDADTLAHHLNGFLAEGDGVLVKGSRGMEMERVIAAIEKLREKTKWRVD